MDINSLTREQLIEQADLLGVKFSTKDSTETIKQKVQRQLGEPVEEPTLSHPSLANNEERITIILNESETDRQPVQVGVNGTTYVMERGKPVDVPKCVLEVLNNATRKVWDRTMEDYNTVHRYPYRVQM